MQGLAQQVTALRPELVNNDATVGALAVGPGARTTPTSVLPRRCRLWFDGTALAWMGLDFPRPTGCYAATGSSSTSPRRC